MRRGPGSSGSKARLLGSVQGTGSVGNNQVLHQGDERRWGRGLCWLAGAGVGEADRCAGPDVRLSDFTGCGPWGRPALPGPQLKHGRSPHATFRLPGSSVWAVS